jgi:hypothetical protein
MHSILPILINQFYCHRKQSTQFIERESSAAPDVHMKLADHVDTVQLKIICISGFAGLDEFPSRWFLKYMALTINMRF